MVGKTVCEGLRTLPAAALCFAHGWAVPWIASRWLGAMFQVGAGTAATQYSRTAADAVGAAAEATAPVTAVRATTVAACLTGRRPCPS